MSNTINLIEFNLIKNCNLNCKGCNHFSTITDKKEVLELDVLSNDLKRMKELNIDIQRISLLGGEPLLLDNLEDYIIECKQIYPESKIEITTNGLLVTKMSNKLQEALQKHQVLLMISLYPILKKDKLEKEIKNFLKDKNINYKFLIYKNEFRKQLSTEPHIDELKKYCMCGAPTLENGKLYHCPVSAYIYKINEKYNYSFPDNEYIDIYSEDTNANQICNVPFSTIELCKYCSPKNISTYSWEGYYAKKAKSSDWIMDSTEKKSNNYYKKKKIIYKFSKLIDMIKNK